MSNLKQVGIAATSYMNDYKNRFPWGLITTPVYPRSHYFGGTACGGDTGPPWDGIYPKGDLPAGQRPLNKYLLNRTLQRDSNTDVAVLRCPNDDGVRSRVHYAYPKSNMPASFVMGTSYGANVTWWEYVRTSELSELSRRGISRDDRVLHLMKRLMFIYEKKGASRAVLFFEDPADCTMGGVLYDWPEDLRYRTWHMVPNYYSVAFLDGHAEHLYMDHKKVRDYDYMGAGGRINTTCTPATRNCINGDARWFARHDWMAQ